MISLPVPVNEQDHIIGKPHALVTVVQYGDYGSPDCQKMHKAIERVAGSLLNEVRLVYRHFPLVKVHPQALRAAEAAEAAAAQGKFWEMHALLYLNPGRLKDNDFREHAKQIDLDQERFEREMYRGIYAPQILKDRDIGVTNGISGVPTFFVNDRLWAMANPDLPAAVRDFAERLSAA